MTERVKYFITILALVIASLFSFSCTELSVTAPHGPVTVGFYAGGTVTRSQINDDGLSAEWTEGDKVSLFARNSSGSWTLSGQQFKLYGGTDNDMAAFTATLPQPMPEDEYEYIACYPEPVSVSGTRVSCILPSVQNGRASGGADIMVSAPAVSGPLTTIPAAEDYSTLRVSMKHLIHLLRFYLPEGSNGLNGEDIQRIDVQMPVPVCGNLEYDITDPESTLELTDGSSSLSLNLDRPIGPSTETARDYACAAVAPFTASDGDVMDITMYSESWKASVEAISLNGRDFKSGHATAVKLTVKDIKPIFCLYFNLVANNIGEPVRKITFTAPSGCVFSDGGSNEYVYEPGGDIAVGTQIRIQFEDEAAFRAFNGQTVQVAYDSDHVLAYQNVTPSTVSGTVSNVSLTAPYLLDEDFSVVPSFSSDDKYKTSSTGSMSAYGPFLNGWSGGRIGASAGSMVRLACRRETGLWVEALYDSRMESAPIATIKSPVSLKVSFDYGGNGNGLSDSDILGQTISLGYVTSTDKYSSGATDGTFEGSPTIHISASEYGTDWTTPYHGAVTVPSVPAGNTVRISWKSHMDSKPALAGNSTSWFYLDNVKVQVAQ